MWCWSNMPGEITSQGATGNLPPAPGIISVDLTTNTIGCSPYYFWIEVPGDSPRQRFLRKLASLARWCGERVAVWLESKI